MIALISHPLSKDGTQVLYTNRLPLPLVTALFMCTTDYYDNLALIHEDALGLEKLTRACFLPNSTRKHAITYTN